MMGLRAGRPGDARQPGRQQAVRVVGEVVGDQCVEQVVVAVEQGGGEGDQLPVPSGTGAPGGARQRRGVTGQDGRHHQLGDVGAAGEWVGHAMTMTGTADGTLTAADGHQVTTRLGLC
jgi:hypothetical protein